MDHRREGVHPLADRLGMGLVHRREREGEGEDRGVDPLDEGLKGS